MSWKDSLKLTVATVGIMTLRFVPLFLLGIAINWFYVTWNLHTFVLYFDLESLSSIGVAGRTPFAVILVLLPFGIVVGLFLFVFPILYWLVLQSYAIKSGLGYIFRKKKTAIFEYFVPKLVESSGDWYQNSALILKTRKSLTKFVAQMDNMPKALRRLCLYLVKRIPFQEALSEIILEIGVKEENYDLIAERLTERLSSHIEKEILNASLKVFFFLFIFNIGTMYYVMTFFS